MNTNAYYVLSIFAFPLYFKLGIFNLLETIYIYLLVEQERFSDEYMIFFLSNPGSTLAQYYSMRF